ncbi:MAG: TIGR00725 family protein [Desulfatitalea sp.]|nr:TIGR00725 family protein [Desulfatitalea sp.]NNK00131.1 TIGR00725 family protein [Desulfatitalea sp.]
MKRPPIIGVMGGGQATDQDIRRAYDLGRLIAVQGWVLLNGGRNSGIMAASARGAAEHGGITVGVLPDDHLGQCAPGIQIPIRTGMGSARNTINVLSSDIVVACPGGSGTLSEIALALKHAKPIILLAFDVCPLFERIGQPEPMPSVQTPEEVILHIQNLLRGKSTSCHYT